MVHAVRSRSIVTLGLRGITVTDLSDTVVHVAAVLPWQAAVEILRRVNRLTPGFIVSAGVNDGTRVSLRGKRHRHADVVTSLGTATTQVFSQPLSYAATTTTAAAAASNVAVLGTIAVASLVSTTKRTKILIMIKLCLCVCVCFFQKKTAPIFRFLLLCYTCIQNM